MNWPTFAQELVNLQRDNTFLTILKICPISQAMIKFRAVLFLLMQHITTISQKPMCTPFSDFYKPTQQINS